MNRYFLAALGAVTLAVSALIPTTPSMAEDLAIYPDTIWNNTRLLTNATATSTPIPLAQRKPTGYFSVQLWSTNTVGTVTVRYQLSNDGQNYYPEQGIANLVITNAPAGGVISGNFFPPVATHIRYLATVTNDGATITAIAAMQ